MRMRLRNSILALLTLAPSAAVAQVAAQPARIQAQRSPHSRASTTSPGVQSIIDGAGAVPPEFGADVLIRLAASPQIAGPATKVGLLERAFDLAASAQQPVRFGAVTRLVDSRSGSSRRSSTLELDQLSLQVRAIQAMLLFDRVKARALAERIHMPSLQPLDCDYPLLYDLNPFYRTIGAVARDAFTAKEKADGDAVAFLTPYVSSLQTHAQVAPVAEMLQTAGLSSPDRGQLSLLFGQALSRLQGDPRSFAESWQWARAIRGLLGTSGVYPVPLLTALRQYLIANYSGLRCGEIAKPIFPEAVKSFNERYAVPLANYQIPPITEDEIKDFHTGATAPAIPYWESEQSRRLLFELRMLRFGGQASALNISQRSTPEWSTKEVAYLSELEGWEPSSEPSLNDFFDEKSILYQALVTTIPAGMDHGRALNSYVNFLELTSAEDISRAEWFFPAHVLLSECVEAHDCREVIGAFIDSRDPTLNLYGTFERDVVLVGDPQSRR